MRAWRSPTSRTAGCCPALPSAIAALDPPLRSYPTAWNHIQLAGHRDLHEVWLTALWTGNTVDCFSLLVQTQVGVELALQHDLVGQTAMKGVHYDGNCGRTGDLQ